MEEITKAIVERSFVDDFMMYYQRSEVIITILHGLEALILN